MCICVFCVVCMHACMYICMCVCMYVCYVHYVCIVYIVCRNQLKEACRKDDSNKVKEILERVKAERKDHEPVLNLRHKVSP